MENIGKLNIGKPTEGLKAKRVLIVDYRVETVEPSGNMKTEGQKIVFECNHPDLEGKKALNLNQVVYMKNKTQKQSGIWFKKDEQGLISGNSALAQILNFYDADNLDQMKGKEVDTVKGENDYLAIKAY